MTTLKNLVNQAYDLYSEMQGNRWLGIVRNDKAPLLQAIKDIENNPLEALIALENSEPAASKLKIIASILSTVAKLDNNTIKAAEAHATLAATEEKFLADFQGLSQQFVFLQAIKDFVLTKSLAENLVLINDNASLKSALLAETKKLSKSQDTLQTESTKLAELRDRYADVLTKQAASQKAAITQRLFATPAVKADIDKHPAPGHGCAAYNLRK